MRLESGFGSWTDLEHVYEQESEGATKPRHISKLPYKVLDAPQLQDDFYLNLVDWSSQNVLAVGLTRSVYVWSACTSQVQRLCQVAPDNVVTSVSWSNKGNHVAVGTNFGSTEVWDVQAGKVIRTLDDHLGRISALAWNGSILSSGSRDATILSSDLRMKDAVAKRHVGHR